VPLLFEDERISIVIGDAKQVETRDFCLKLRERDIATSGPRMPSFIITNQPAVVPTTRRKNWTASLLALENVSVSFPIYQTGARASALRGVSLRPSAHWRGFEVSAAGDSQHPEGQRRRDGPALSLAVYGPHRRYTRNPADSFDGRSSHLRRD
jgi:hypothetical protein